LTKRTAILLKALAFGIAIFGPVALLWLAAIYAVLSPREVAIGMVVWFVTLLVVTLFRKLGASNATLPNAEPGVMVDERTRKRILRGIWINKIWIGLLAVSLPFGIVIGMANRAWLPVLGGVGINLFLMYVALREIKQQQNRLDSTR
jgi:hypothetical protein